MKIIIGTIIAFGLMIMAGNSEYVENYNKEMEQQEQVEQVVEPTEQVVEQKDKDTVYLEELEAQLEGMNAIEIQQYLEKHNIEYSFDEVTGYPYKQWCIIIPKGIYVIHIHWYDDRVEEIYMGIENANETDSVCIKYGIHVYN